MSQPQPTPPHAASAPQRVDRDSFLANVRKSGLVSEERLAKSLSALPATERASSLARHLVAEKLLTKFQAERLLVGLTDGFVMGQYRILDQIGRGGMGRVFKAEHVAMGRVVALKVLDPNLTKTDRARELFQREVRAAARLSHANIVTAFDANQVGDRHFLVMEFVDGPNLQDLVKEHGPLPVSQACDYVRQAALGLQYAHDLGMVHRDVKPANLLVSRGPGKANPAASAVKILDFGLARLHAPGEDEEAGTDSIETSPQSVMGTPDYLAPEQARSLRGVDARSDLYSLGCTFYYLLTGEVPFPGGTTLEKLMRHTTAPAPSVRRKRPDVPEAVEQVVARLMAKDPADRYPSANDLAAALASFADGGVAKWVPIVPRPEGNTLPVSGLHTRPPADLLLEPEPWSSLGHDESALATLPGESGHTTEATPLTPVRLGGRYRRPGRKGKSSGGLWIVWLALIVAVLTGAAFAVRFLIQKAGS